MNEKQIEVITWWHGRRDYRTGIALLLRYCKNNTIISTLAKQDKEKFPASIRKLNYELTKSVQLNWLNMPDDISEPSQTLKKSLTDTPSQEKLEYEKNNPLDNSFPPENEKKIDETNQYPKVIRKLKYEYSNLYNKKSKLHAEMRLVEQTNTEKNNELRSDFLNEIKSISIQLEFYFSYIDKYEKTGLVPDEAEIWPPSNESSPEEPKTLAELKVLMKSLRGENYKDGFKLLYQQRTKGKFENPMPAGDKRYVIETRLSKREEKLAQVLDAIKKIENAS